MSLGEEYIEVEGYYAYCDNCEACGPTVQDEDYAYDEFFNCEGGEFIEGEISGSYYDLLCGACVSDLTLCEWCEEGYTWSDDRMYCYDMAFAFDHEKCLIEYHNDLFAYPSSYGLNAEEITHLIDEDGACGNCAWVQTYHFTDVPPGQKCLLVL